MFSTWNVVTFLFRTGLEPVAFVVITVHPAARQFSGMGEVLLSFLTIVCTELVTNKMRNDLDRVLCLNDGQW